MGQWFKPSSGRPAPPASGLVQLQVDPVRQHNRAGQRFLGRYLKRRLVGVEAETRVHNADCARVAEWIPDPPQHQQVPGVPLAAQSRPEPGLLSCPMEPAESRLGSTSEPLHSSAHPGLCARGLQMYGRRASWEDPLRTRHPAWPAQDEDHPLHIHPEDVGSTSPRQSPGLGASVVALRDGGSPLFNMLMTLQEAANTESGDL